MHVKTIVCVLSVFLCASIARAQTPGEGLTWEDCLTEARRNHPDLVSAFEKVNQNKADKDIVRSNALPQVSADLDASTGKTTGHSQADSYSYGATARQLLFDGFKTSNDLAAARANINAALYDYDVTSSNIRLRLRTAFIDLLEAQELLKVSQNIAERRKKNVDMINLRYEGGREHRGSLFKEQANFAQAQFNVEQALRGIELSQRRLSKELGREQFVPVTAVGQLEVVDFDMAKPDFEDMVNTVPFLKELAARKEAAKWGVKSARSDFFPQIYANADAGKSDVHWPPRPNTWSAGLSVTFPLFEGGAQQAQLSKARAAFKQSQADQRSGRDGMVLTLAETWTDWQDNVALIAVQKKFLDASTERARIAEAQYSSGLISFNDWTIIEDDLVRNQNAFLQARANAMVSQADWAQAKGETLDE